MGESKTRQRKAKKGKGKTSDDVSSDTDTKEVMKAPTGIAVVIIGQIFLSITVVFILFICYVQCPIEPVPLIIEHSLPSFTEVMEPNQVLQEVVKIGVDELVGPESIQVDSSGTTYTGLKDGRIVKIEKFGAVEEPGYHRIHTMVRTGENLPNCGDPDIEHICGRPLGLHLDKSEENLLICDSYLGLFKLNLKTNELIELIPASVGINQVPFKFLNHLAVSTSGKIYFTDSSWKWSRRDHPYVILEGGGQGRFMSFDMNTNETEVLLDGLFFANGVALSPNEDYAVISETTKSRIVRVWLSGDKKGVYDIFTENLPGYPDNIRSAKDGGFWVALPAIRKWPFSFLDSIGPYPRIKSILAKILPKDALQKFVKTYGLVVKLDSHGDIVTSYHDPSGKVVSHISEAYEDSKEGVLYLGSFKQNFLGMLKLNSVNSQE